jgi:hypothetical protein
MQNYPAQRRGAGAVRKHQAQTEARINDFRFLIFDSGRTSVESKIGNPKSKMGMEPS